MKIAHYTDLHLSTTNVLDFTNSILRGDGGIPFDEVWVTGDISEGRVLCGILEEIRSRLPEGVPFRYILGNHDLRDGVSREQIYRLDSGSFQYLHGKFEPLGAGSVVMGIDGYYDARSGAGYRTYGATHDIDRDHSFHGMSQYDWLREVTRRSDRHTDELLVLLDELPDSVKSVYLLTHVPPFEGACLYGDKPTEWEYLPFMCNKGMGFALSAYAEDRRKSGRPLDITVFCGHTHSSSDHEEEGILCRVGKSGNVPRVFDIPTLR